MEDRVQVSVNEIKVEYEIDLYLQLQIHVPVQVDTMVQFANIVRILLNLRHKSMRFEL